MMIINVKNLSADAPQKFECSSLCSLPADYGVSSPFPVKVSGTLTKSSANTVLLEGKLVAELALACGRCLEAVKYELVTDFDAELSKEEGESTIDISPQVDEHIILNIPQKILCSEDCEGLCHSCGANLNTEECGCERDIDPRLSLLKNMILNEGGERDGNLS